MKRNIIFLLFSIFISIALISCSSSEESEEGNADLATETKAATSGPKVSFAADDLEGQTHTEAEFTGQPLIINFWGTWCGPCRMEMPAMQKIYDEYKSEGLEIIGLAWERPGTPPQKVQEFVNQNGYNWVMLLGNKEVAKSLKLGSGVPYTIFVNKEGQVVHTHTGLMSYAGFKEQVEKII